MQLQEELLQLNHCAKDTSMTKKSTRAEKNIRVNDVITKLNRGWSRHDIQQYASEKWSITERTCDEYIAQASKTIIESYEIEYPDMAKTLHSMFMEVYRMAVEDRDLRAAIQALRESGKITGAYAPEKHEVTHRQRYISALMNGRITPEKVREIAPNMADELFEEAGIIGV